MGNHIVLTGKVIKEPVQKTIKNGSQISEFLLESTQKPNSSSKDVFKVEAWGNLATVCMKIPMLSTVALTGSIHQDSYPSQFRDSEGNTSFVYLKVTAENVDYLQTEPDKVQMPAEDDLDDIF